MDADLRFYNEKERSFHAKSYIFHYASHSEIVIGSSNISRIALTSGIEWNYRFSSRTDSENYQKFFETFEDLFKHHSILIDDTALREYSKSWHRPAVEKDLAEIAKTPAFAQHMGDIIDYRTMDYYQRRYHESCV